MINAVLSDVRERGAGGGILEERRIIKSTETGSGSRIAAVDATLEEKGASSINRASGRNFQILIAVKWCVMT